MLPSAPRKSPDPRDTQARRVGASSLRRGSVTQEAPSLQLVPPPSPPWPCAGNSPRSGRRPSPGEPSRSCGRSSSWRRTSGATWTGSHRRRSWTWRTPQLLATLVPWLKRAWAATVGNLNPAHSLPHASLRCGLPSDLAPALSNSRPSLWLWSMTQNPDSDTLPRLYPEQRLQITPLTPEP